MKGRQDKYKEVNSMQSSDDPDRPLF